MSVVRALHDRVPAGLRADIRRALEEWPEQFGAPSVVAPDLVRHWERVIARGRGLLERTAAAGPTVLILSTLGRKMVWPARAAVVAYALRIRGARPVFLNCDRWLAACEEGHKITFGVQDFVERGPRKLCDACFGGQDQLFRALGLPYRSLSQFDSAEARARIDSRLGSTMRDELYALRYKGIELGPHIEESLLRFFWKNTRTRWDDHELLEPLVRRYARGALESVESTEAALAEIRPDVLVVHYGAYVSRGLPPLVAERDGVRTVVLAAGLQDRTWTAGLGANIVTELERRREGPWVDSVLTVEQERRLDAWLFARERGTVTKVPLRDPISSADALYRELSIDPSRPLVTLFTSIGWDSKSFYDTPTYPMPEDWIADTIRLVRERPSLQLVIRCHPAETYFSEPERFADAIRRQHPALPPNVRIVPGESRLSSYTLARSSAAALVYGSTLGIELACAGVPVICSGRAPYRGKGFTFDVSTTAEYAASLDRVGELVRNDPTRMAAARRFANYYFFQRELPFPFWQSAAELEKGVLPWWRRFRSLDDLLPGREPGLDAICGAILEGREPYRPDV